MSVASLTGRTEVVAIIGWPVAHSLSPVIHNAAFAAAGLDWVYVALPVEPGNEGGAIDGIRTLGLRGVNVTMPHKRVVLPLLDEVAEEARRVGAVNTIVREGARLLGANTDGPGFVRFLEHDAGVPVGGKRTLLLGAGGSARAVAASLADAGGDVVVAARRPEQASELLGLGARAIVAWDHPTLTEAAGEAEIVVNATPSREIPFDPAPLGPRHTVVDLIYPPPPTPLVEAARARGAVAHTGLGMLVRQAALSFEVWTGVPAPLEAMSAAALAALNG